MDSNDAQAFARATPGATCRRMASALCARVRSKSTIWVVVTCMGRREFLKTTAPGLLAQQEIYYCLVDYSCPEGSGDWFAGHFASEIRDRRAAVVRVEHRPYFEKSKALNAGARRAVDGGAQFLCFLDVDTVGLQGLGSWLSQHVREDRFLIAGSSPDGGDVASLTGLLVAPAAAFVASGGYDEEMIGWGAEDIDMRLRLHLKEKMRYSRVPLQFLSYLDHDNDLRAKHYNLPLSESNARNVARARAHVREWTQRDLHQLDAEARRLTFWPSGFAGPPWQRDIHYRMSLRLRSEMRVRSDPGRAT
jgi:hypothetical protein